MKSPQLSGGLASIRSGCVGFKLRRKPHVFDARLFFDLKSIDLDVLYHTGCLEQLRPPCDVHSVPNIVPFVLGKTPVEYINPL
jgi:hypothetical protein